MGTYRIDLAMVKKGVLLSTAWYGYGGKVNDAQEVVIRHLSTARLHGRKLKLNRRRESREICLTLWYRRNATTPRYWTQGSHRRNRAQAYPDDASDQCALSS